MSLDYLLSVLVWTGAGAVLLFLLMFIDSLFTRYKDMEEIKKGNMAVTTRFVIKLMSQGYILSQSIIKSDDLLEALAVSIISFVVLLILELIVRIALKASVQLNLDEGTKEGKVAHGLFAGSLHAVGALIIAACL